MDEKLQPDANQLGQEEAGKSPAAGKKPEKKKAVKTVSKRPAVSIKLFGKWDSDVVVNDLGLREYVNLRPVMVPRTAGALQKQSFHKSKIHLVERMALHLMVSGHQGKKHKLTSGRFGGAFSTALSVVEKALDIVEKTEKKNPIEVFVRAVENAAVSEEIISYQMGSVMAREAVITAPQRRLDKVLRTLAQGAYRSRFNKKTSMAQSLANEIIGAAKGTEGFAIKERERIEREAMGTR